MLDDQRKRLIAEGKKQTDSDFEDVAYEEMVADACMKFLASKNAVAQIQALKTENKGLWAALKKFFTSLFNKINKIYKTVPPDSAEAKYLANMRNAIKPIRDAFFEGAVVASKNSAKTKTKEITNKAPTKSADIRYSNRDYAKGLSETDKIIADRIIERLNQRTMSSKYGVVASGAYTRERIERELAYSSAEGHTDYANSYIAWISPEDFINATTGSNKVRELLTEEAGTLDAEKLSNEKQPIYLIVDFETGKIVGHEGRHRMIALKKAGIERVAVVIEARNNDLYNTKPVNMMYLKGQYFNRDNVGADFYLHDALPLSQRYADTVTELFSHTPKNGVRFSSRKSIDTKAQKDYNYFRWVRENNVISSSVYSNFTTEFSKAVTSNAYNDRVSDLGEYMIEAGETSGKLEGVKNYIVFAKGEIGSPEITRIVKINVFNNTDLSDISEDIYEAERKGIRTKTEGLLEVHAATDYGVQLYGLGGIKKNAPNNNRLGIIGGTGSRTTQRVKEILFDEEGNEVKREYRYSRRDRYTSGQVAQIKANLGTGKVYSKASAMKLVSDLAPKIRRRSFDVLSDELWRGLNTYTTAEDKRAFSEYMAEMFVDRMMVDTLVKHREWDVANEK